MKTINEILNNYSKYKTFLDDRFGARLCQFLTDEQSAKIGFKKVEGAGILEWSEENVLNQLKEDVEFGWEKAMEEKSISSNLMFYVVRSWCNVLENGCKDWDETNYGPYGKPLFIAVDELYNWGITDER